MYNIRICVHKFEQTNTYLCSTFDCLEIHIINTTKFGILFRGIFGTNFVCIHFIFSNLPLSRNAQKFDCEGNLFGLL